MTAIWQLWLTWGLMAGVGTGMTAMVLGATVASRWFTARRGLGAWDAGCEHATGQLAFLPLAQWLADAITGGGSRCCRRRARAWSPGADGAVRRGPSRRTRAAAVRRDAVVVAAAAAQGGAAPRGAPHARGRVRQPRVLGAVLDLLRLRPVDQRSDPDTFHPALRRFRHPRRAGGGLARGDGRCSTSSARSARATCPTVSTAASCCSGITGCAGFR